jgi:hypothetical protein
MGRTVRVEEEYARAEVFGRWDLRVNRLIAHLVRVGELANDTDACFAAEIGRSSQCVNYWRNFLTFPNSVSLVYIAKRFEVSLDWMCGFHGNNLTHVYRRGSSHRAPASLSLIRGGKAA